MLHPLQPNSGKDQGKCISSGDGGGGGDDNTSLCGYCDIDPSISCSPTNNNDCPSAGGVCDSKTTSCVNQLDANGNCPCTSNDDCLPNSGNPNDRGSCLQASPSLCIESTCNPTSSPTSKPTFAPTNEVRNYVRCVSLIAVQQTTQISLHY